MPDIIVAVLADAYHQAIEDGAAALVDALAVAPDQPVPTCPGWDMARLGAHVGLIYEWAAEQVLRRAKEPIDRSTLPQPPEQGELVGWLTQMAARALAALRAAADGEPAGGWRDRAVTASFWRRRLAHETVIHRTDADAALGRSVSVPQGLATDGIEEVFDLYLPYAPQRAAAWPPPGVLRLVEDDEGAVWSLQARLASVVVHRGSDEVQLAIEATAQFTFHLKNGVVADLAATATIIVDPAERRRVLAVFVAEFNRRRGPDSPWPEAVLGEWVERSPLAKVTFADTD